MFQSALNETRGSTLLALLEDAVSRSASGRSLGVLILEVENFSRLVSLAGYSTAIAAVTELAQRLQQAIRRKDKLVHCGEARFALIIADVHNEEHLILAANKLLRTAEEDLTVGRAHDRLRVRIGMALSPEHADNADDLIRLATTALLTARESGEKAQLFSSGETTQIAQLWSLEDDLRDALDQGSLRVYYQPKILARTGRPCGAEGLLRWPRPDGSFVSPETFVPIADATGLTESLTWFTLNRASREAMLWSDRCAPLTVALNVTANVLERCDLIRLAQNAAGLWSLPPDRMTIELTESAFMNNPGQCFDVLTQLREAGFKVAIDDFGTGYSSMSYFKNIPADELKIDKSFVMNMRNDAADMRIVRAIVALAHSFGLAVTAEGVEDAETAALLTDIGCDYLQGFHFSRALPQEAFLRWLEETPFEPHAA